MASRSSISASTRCCQASCSRSRCTASRCRASLSHSLSRFFSAIMSRSQARSKRSRSVSRLNSVSTATVRFGLGRGGGGGSGRRFLSDISSRISATNSGSRLLVIVLTFRLLRASRLLISQRFGCRSFESTLSASLRDDTDICCGMNVPSVHEDRRQIVLPIH
jgi:hypothetical protein